MRRPLLFIISCLLLTPATQSVAGIPKEVEHVWHVSPTELTGIPGAAQFRTISEAAAKAEAGDTVMIHGGTYRERVVVAKSGTAERPIRFAAAPGEHVVVTGADRITAWEKDPMRPVYHTPWPYEFEAHPDERYRPEQVLIAGYELRQAPRRELLAPGAFFVDAEGKRLYVEPFGDQEITSDTVVEAAARDTIWDSRGDHLRVSGIVFRYAANRAQLGAAQFEGNSLAISDCTFERTAGCGASFTGSDIRVERCTFADNGQLGFAAVRAHRLLLTDCLVRDNNTRDFPRQWEAGGNKMVLSRGVVLEHSTFVANRGAGIWFDIGNEDCTVRNCLIADNEDAGLFYEISFGLHAHDNVIVGNGFADTPGAWGAQAGISLSSSPDCLIERNLLVGNREGLNFREQLRTTPLIEDHEGEQPIWNHDEAIRRNIIAYNREAQTWGWFDVDDERHWPAAMQSPDRHDLSLEKLRLALEHNLYWAAPGQDLFNWGADWGRHRHYPSLDAVRAELHLEQESVAERVVFANFAARDFRLPESAVLAMECYPRGDVPGVILGRVPEP